MAAQRWRIRFQEAFAMQRPLRSVLLPVLAMLLLLISVGTPADDASWSCGYQVVTVGAPITKLRQACGVPDRVVRLQNEKGAAVGERWEYQRGQSLVLFTLSGGRVVRIQRL
jgi:hypothetical protein